MGACCLIRHKTMGFCPPILAGTTAATGSACSCTPRGARRGSMVPNQALRRNQWERKGKSRGIERTENGEMGLRWGSEEEKGAGVKKGWSEWSGVKGRKMLLGPAGKGGRCSRITT